MLRAKVKPKKHLGQHFLKDLSIAEDITLGLTSSECYQEVLEIGPGMGVLTDFLLKRDFKLSVIDIDNESILYLKKKYEGASLEIIQGDFLKIDWNTYTTKPFAVIGNFPYNISSQIFFKILDFKNQIPEVVCMLQKEVAERLCAGEGHSDGGILGVFLQCFYTAEYLFTVEAHVFDPPPKVRSGVIRLKRNLVQKLDCDEVVFRKVVKMAFGMRRKTLRNALKALQLPSNITEQTMFGKRAEQLTVADFVTLTNIFTNNSLPIIDEVQ